jgi:hypothetical protein
MTIWEISDFIDLITAKERGGYNTYAEKEEALDRASMTLFSFYRPKYATSIVAKEALSPFRVRYDFTTDGDGEFTLSVGQEFLHLLAMNVVVTDPDAPSGYNEDRRYAVSFPNEDELADRLNSQTKQPTRTAPICDIVEVGFYNLYPQVVHEGTIYYLKRPLAPVLAYTQSGRTITPDLATSVDLEWTEPYLNNVIFLALRFLGINLQNEVLTQIMSEFLGEAQ